MCSYNQINGSYGCQNSWTLNGLLKGELGFQGFVVTDWGAQHSGLASAEAGLDMVMPSSEFWVDGNLTLM
jgi:beta-glucosidase